MNRTRRIAATALVLLLGATVYGLIRTTDAPNLPKSPPKSTPAAPAQALLVDQSPLKTARQLARLASTPEERPLAQEALRFADYEVDASFDAALRAARAHPPALSAEAQQMQERLQKAEKLVETDQARIVELATAVAQATGERKAALQSDLDQVIEDLDVDQNDVDDAELDLVRAGGNLEARIKEMKKEHEDATHEETSSKDATHEVKNAAAETALPAEQRGLIARYQQWSSLQEKQRELLRAKQDAEAAVAALTAQHNALDARIAEEKSKSPQLARHTKQAPLAGGPASAPAPTSRNREEAAALLQKTKVISEDQKILTSFDKRIDDEKQLADIYGQWIGVVAAERRGVINHALRGVLVILAIAMLGFGFASWTEKALGRLNLDRRQVQTLVTVTRVSMQVVGVLLVLLVIFGPPGQLGTFLGLAGAGLTVALKDFIVSFIGWFVLMGKNGIRLGDWVEINGVTGEVVELGMFRTVLLETGNWTDSGHPTGRRVTFTNSFAIEGHYFNFSTSGQWLWDELKIVLPSGQDPYPMVDAIRKKVLEATSESASQAEREWKAAARSREMSALSAAPAINVKPVVGGFEVSVRYITRASERSQMRARLYQVAVDLLGGKARPASAGAA